MRRLALCMFCAMACEVGVAQTFDEAARKGRLDQVASFYSGKNTFMGTVLVAGRDRILLNKGYGMAATRSAGLGAVARSGASYAGLLLRKTPVPG